MLIVNYLVLAVIIVLLSIKLSAYVDLLDKKTNLSGAFLGGVMLAAVTSLPELFTSTSSVLFLNEPELVIGNILGSNLFNVAALSVVSLFGLKTVMHTQVAASHKITVLYSVAIYILIAIVAAGFCNFYIFGINIVSFMILVLYILGVRQLSADEGVAENEDAEDSNSPLTPKEILVRFAIMSVILVTTSIAITFATQALNVEYHLGTSFAGAVFLGLATSLPEFVSTMQLVRLNNYNAACGNILGSNLFNFIILFLSDLLYSSGSIYIFSYQSRILLITGIIASLTMLIFVRCKSDNVIGKISKGEIAFNVVLLLIGVGAYFAFLALSLSHV